MRGGLLLAAVLVASLLAASAYSTSSTEKPEPQAVVQLGSFEWCADIYCGKTASVGQTVRWFARSWGYGLLGTIMILFYDPWFIDVDFATAKANFNAFGAVTACELRNDGLRYYRDADAYVLVFRSYIVGTNIWLCPVDGFFDFSTHSTATPRYRPGQYKACVILINPYGLGYREACDTLTVK